MASKVHYKGPGHESDPRTMAVSADEADRLVATGLWSTAKPKKAANKASEVTKKKENDDA